MPEQDMAAAVRGVLEESGLDVTWCDEALRDPGTWDAVLREHSELVGETRSFGVPTIILDGGDGPATPSLPVSGRSSSWSPPIIRWQ